MDFKLNQSGNVVAVPSHEGGAFIATLKSGEICVQTEIELLAFRHERNQVCAGDIRSVEAYLEPQEEEGTFRIAGNIGIVTVGSARHSLVEFTEVAPVPHVPTQQ